MKRMLIARTGLSTGLLLLPTLALAQTAAPAPVPAPPADCQQNPDPYKNYNCLDAYLGDGVLERLINYYSLEMGHATAPSAPNAPPGRIASWPATPESTPPMSFTEWPYGGTNPLGVTRPNSVDSPLMVAMANTGVGQWMTQNDFQFYGWVDPGFNVSSNWQKPGGNSPVAYAYTPNTVQLDQTVVYLDRFADTVQTDHIDWGLRLSAIYGENYRYTTGYGYDSYQYLKHNNQNGVDFPMEYLDIYVPQILDGMNIRIGRYISVPDIEAQLAPNNYMYTHSLTYALDNYTNTGIMTTTALTQSLFFQLGLSVGTEAAPWHVGETVRNPYPNTPETPNPLYPGTTFLKDPGAQFPSVTMCLRYTWNNGADDIQPCMDAINSGRWGYNNLQWYGFTFYHKFNDQWHIAFETYDEGERDVPNADNSEVQTIYKNGGTPFSPQFITYNAPDMAQCNHTSQLTCSTSSVGVVSYLNYSPDALDNFSFRPEYYADMQGQRTGTKADYYEISFGWQHWLSPQIEFRPEIGYYRAINAVVFNANPTHDIAPNRNYTAFLGGDAILHF